MTDKLQPVDARKVLEDQKAEALQRAKEIDHDLAELERLGEIAKKHGWQIVNMALPSPPKVARTPPKPKPTINVEGPVSVQVVEAAADFLRRRGARAQSGVIAVDLVGRGIRIGEKPGKKVSSYLTRSNLFDNKPEFGGYGLAEWKGARTAVTPPSPYAKDK